MLLPATFDNASKLLSVKGQDYIGAVTYGAGAIGQREPRTASSFVPELEEELSQAKVGRLPVEEFAQKLSEFFMRQWTTAKMPVPCPPGNDMVFLVAGYDVGAPYGKVFEIYVPTRPTPIERIPANQFGMAWGASEKLRTESYRDSILNFQTW